jgi:hypothetical protein
MTMSAATSRRPDDIFVDLFSQVFGVERTQLLTPELNTPTSTKTGASLISRSRPLRAESPLKLTGLITTTHRNRPLFNKKTARF